MPFDVNQLDPGDIGTRYHLATLGAAEFLKLPFEQAEAFLRDPANKVFLDIFLEQARLGDFNYLTVAATPQGTGGTPTTGTGKSDAVGAANAIVQGNAARETVELDKLRKEIAQLEQSITSAKNADDRADKMLTLQQKQHDLAVRSQRASEDQHRQTLYGNVAQNLLSTATQLRGPRDYPQFVAATSGGRGLIDQLFGSQPRPAFSAPAGPIEPQTMAGLLSQLGLGGGLTGQVAKDLGYGG